MEHVTRTETEWLARLTPLQFQVMRRRGTEPQYLNAYWNNCADGAYACAGCGTPLFDSPQKFDGHTGWPCFRRPLDAALLGETPDPSFGLERAAVHCAACGCHLGHAMDGDGGTRAGYCVNSAALKFSPRKPA